MSGVDVPESVEWVQLSRPKGKTYYWNTRTHATSWNPPEDSRIVWATGAVFACVWTSAADAEPSWMSPLRPTVVGCRGFGGGGDVGSQTPRCSATLIRCIQCSDMETHVVVSVTSASPPPTTQF